MQKGSLATLKQGETLLVAIKGTRNPAKIQLEVAEKVRQQTAIEAFNADDSAFQGVKARRGWMTVSVAQTKEIWPELAATIDQAAKGKTVEVNILNPTHPEFGQLHLRIVENTVGEIADLWEKTTSKSQKSNYAYQLENLSKTAKRAGADGGYLAHGGEPILSNVTVQFGSQSHTFLASDPQRLSVVEDMNLGSVLSEAPLVGKEEEVEA